MWMLDTTKGIGGAVAGSVESVIPGTRLGPSRRQSPEHGAPGPAATDTRRGRPCALLLAPKSAPAATRAPFRYEVICILSSPDAGVQGARPLGARTARAVVALDQRAAPGDLGSSGRTS